MSVGRLAAAVLLLWSGWSWAAAASVPAPVRVATGLVQGHIAGNTVRYLGIPYAAPPVGALRWQPPRAPAAWDGVLDAARFSPACIQMGGYFGSDDPATFGKPFGDEDCLYLNVWTPAPVDAPRPVLVFIHGGAGVAGATSLGVYDATRLAGELGAVVVSMNYRLGFFGAMPVAEVQQDHAASFGLLDQLQALRWVRDNIAAFGGDPDNVTVMGHSAGGVAIWTMLRAEAASGLFTRAIVLSGIPLRVNPDKTREYGDELLRRLLRRDGMLDRDDDLDAVRGQMGGDALRDYLYALDAGGIIEAAGELKPQAAEPDDGDDVLNPVPTIVGSVGSEASMLLLKRYLEHDTLAFWDLINSGRSDLRVSDFFGSWTYLKFRVSTYFANRTLRGLVDRSADRLAATSVPVFRYAFEWDRMPQPWRKLFGAYHGIDVPFLFGNFLDGTPNFSKFTWAPQTVAEREAIHAALVAGLRGFVESGDPARYPGAIEWKRWDQKHHYTVVR
ncbi:MAG: carboxylesterase family protein [Nevskiales bacterium]|nr:carboxylesterase family protein [Nevskiales bacterium]